MRSVALWSAVAGICAAATAAQAADLGVMPVRPAYIPNTYFSWSGFYLGAHAGYGFNRTQVETEGQAAQNIANVNGGARPALVDISPQGFMGGLQAGFNIQPTGGWVFGIETDLSYANIRDSVTVVTTGLPPLNAPNLNNTFEQKLEYFGTVRGRVGYAFDRALFFATGGLAYGGIDNTVTFTGANNNPIQFLGRDRSIKVGYTVGGGLEYAFTANWSAKAEYLYYDLGGSGDPVNVATQPGTGGVGTGYNSQFDHTGHLVRAGINYRFGGGPVMASY